MKFQQIPPNLLRPDPRNPRYELCKVATQALADNILSIGQQVPLIVTPIEDDFYQIIDGHRRWLAAQLAAIPSLDCVVMLQHYSEADLRLTQLSIEANKVALTSMERSDLLCRIKAETNWSVTELAKAVGLDQGTVSKLLGLQRLDPELKSQVQTGSLRFEEAYQISREPDAEKQRELAQAAAGLKRDQLRQRLKPPKTQPSAGGHTEKAVFELATGQKVTLQDKELSLTRTIAAFSDLLRDLKKALAENLNVRTTEQVLRDRARAAPAT